MTYLKYLDTLRVSEGVRSVWIFADSSHKIFELAKKRVYQVVRADGLKISTDGKSAPSKKRRENDDHKKETQNGRCLLTHSFVLCLCHSNIHCHASASFQENWYNETVVD